MQTICLTRCTSVDAPVEFVIEVLSDARQLPRWAPAFARRVHLEGDHWVAESAGGGRTPVTLRSSPQFGTIDVLVTEAPPIGAYMRAISNGARSELVLSLLVRYPEQPGSLARQQEILGDELRAARFLLESRTPTRQLGS
jgi:hypothetical protein